MPAPNILFRQLPAGMSGALRDEETGQISYIPERPQQQVHPRQNFEQQFNQQASEIKAGLNAQWKIEANALSKTYFKDIRQGKSKLAQLNAKYQRLELDALTELQQEQQRQQQVQQLIGQGTQDMSRKREAMIRMQLEPEAERLVFPKQQDWKLEHGRIMSELNRIQSILDSKGPTGKSRFPLKDTKLGLGKRMEYTASPENQEELDRLLNAKAFYLQQEREGFGNLPIMERKATVLQSSYMQRWGERIVKGGGLGIIPAILARRKPTTFAGRVAADMPRPQQPKKLTKEIARQYLNQYGNRQAAMEAAAREGYVE